MTEATTEVADKVFDIDTATATNTTTEDTATTQAVDTAATTAATETGTTDAADKGDKSEFRWPDEWRDQMSGGDEDIANAIKRYGSPKGVAKALKDAQALIRSGKLKRDMPDASDEKAMAEWRKEQGVPDDPTGYKFPETIAKKITDEDKPMLASFTEFAHAKGAPQAVVDIASEWYFNSLDKMAEERETADMAATEAAEETLRKEWSHAEYKANMTIGKRFLSGIPGVGDKWSEARMPDGRRLGDVPEFVMWAADQGRSQFGDVTFATPDSEARHSSRKAEIEKVMKEDMGKYYEQGLDKEYAEILEREVKRSKR